MACFNHHDRKSVGSCKACGRLLCPECIVEVGKSIACQNRCEDDVRLSDSMTADNIRNMPYVNSVLRSAQSNRLILPGLLIGSGLLCPDVGAL